MGCCCLGPRPLPCPHVTVRQGGIASRERVRVVLSLSSNPSKRSLSVHLVLTRGQAASLQVAGKE